MANTRGSRSTTGGPERPRAEDTARAGADEAPSADDWDIVTGVGVTALGVASARAIETHRPDALINDPYAEAFVHAADLPRQLPTNLQELAGMPIPGEWLLMSRYMGVRTRFFDEYFAGAIAAGIRQGVLLAAGLDTRAFRLDWPADSVVFEIDQPRVLSFKLAVLGAQGARPAARHRLVPVDLRRDWAAPLHAAGHDPAQRTAWLAEGLLAYLDAAAEQRLLDTISTLSAPGSQVAVEDFGQVERLLSAGDLDVARQLWGIDLHSLVHDEPGRDAAAALRRLGWDVRTERSLATAQRYGHPVDPSIAGTFEASRFVTGERRTDQLRA
ncbi:class I SAM-dependent methyltransferase [Frankia sp. AgB32]|uniref:class I SAM-dependent methyltransferase n=1 Tax=Frankia sp. AgB32 TaxID=631119 RepID=UPI00200F3A56|nr:class I SAM-dependent methyltransferase [Frankia sp. AgB32]MCK9898432.1 class I SAM-dependent methyltransferase [Frankia sp. AgB32]